VERSHPGRKKAELGVILMPALKGGALRGKGEVAYFLLLWKRRKKKGEGGRKDIDWEKRHQKKSNLKSYRPREAFLAPQSLER